jgi:hypothetical protein
MGAGIFKIGDNEHGFKAYASPCVLSCLISSFPLRIISLNSVQWFVTAYEYYIA